MRSTTQPFFLTLHTYRLAPHSKGDDTRSDEELARHWALDPLERLAATLPPNRRTAIDERVEARIQNAVDKALAAEPQTLSEFQENARWPSP